MAEIFCEYVNRCVGCPARGLAPRSRAVLANVAMNAYRGVEGPDLETSAKAWLKSIDPPKNAPQNPDVILAFASAATKIAAGDCSEHQII